MNNQTQHEARIEFINTMRGLSVVLVMISHLFLTFWSSRDVIAAFTNMEILSTDLYPTPGYVEFLKTVLPFNFGLICVGFFFLISGYVIPLSFKKYNWKQFLIGRFFRVYPLYFVGFSITLCALAIGSAYSNNPFPHHLYQVVIHYIPGLRDLLASKHIDGIVWTLETEVKFYVICAFATVWLRNKDMRVFIIPLLLGALSIIGARYLAHADVASHLILRPLSGFVTSSKNIIFIFIGVAFHFYHEKAMRLRQLLSLILVLTTLFVLVWHYNVKYELPLAGAKAFLGSIVIFAGCMLLNKKWKSHPIINYMALISYSVYVTHAVMGYILLHILMDLGLSPEMAMLSTITFIIILSSLLHRYIEIPMQKLSKKWVRRFANPQLAYPLASVGSGA